MSREMAKAMTRPSRFHTALGAGKAARRRRYGICPMWQPRAYDESGTWRRSLVRLSPGRSSYKRDLTWTRRETFRADPRRNGVNEAKADRHRSSPTEDRPGGDDGQFLLRHLPS